MVRTKIRQPKPSRRTPIRNSGWRTDNRIEKRAELSLLQNRNRPEVPKMDGLRGQASPDWKSFAILKILEETIKRIFDCVSKNYDRLIEKLEPGIEQISQFFF